MLQSALTIPLKMLQPPKVRLREICVIMFVFCSLLALAQEREEPKREKDRTAPTDIYDSLDQKHAKQGTLPHGDDAKDIWERLLRVQSSTPPENVARFEEAQSGLHVKKFVSLELEHNSSGANIRIDVHYFYPPDSSHPLSRHIIESHTWTGDGPPPFVFSALQAGALTFGDRIPEEFQKQLLLNTPHIQPSNRSLNHSARDLHNAINLGVPTLEPSKTLLFSALPVGAGMRVITELRRMKLSTQSSEEWQKVSSDVNATARQLNFNFRIARKPELLAELARGQSNVVLIIAHSENGIMYLPGLAGETIKLSDLDNIKRTDPANRLIVLITCNAGIVNARVPGFGEALLQNGLARTVFASESLVYAEDVPQLLQAITTHNGNLRDILSQKGYRQIVLDDFARHQYLNALILRREPFAQLR